MFLVSPGATAELQGDRTADEYRVSSEHIPRPAPESHHDARNAQNNSGAEKHYWNNIDSESNPCPTGTNAADDCFGATGTCALNDLAGNIPGNDAIYAAQSGDRVNTQTGSRESLGYRCVDTNGNPVTPEGAPIVITVTQRDFASLPVAPARAHAGPQVGYLPVNMDLVAYAEATEQTLDTTLLGTPVQVRATPVTYRWSFGDGNTLDTARPGQPYPSTEITHRYEHQGWYDVSLTTTYAGEFSVNGGPWQDIDGTITVSSDPVPLYSRSFASNLVDPNDDPAANETIELPPRTPENYGPQDPHPQHRKN